MIDVIDDEDTAEESWPPLATPGGVVAATVAPAATVQRTVHRAPCTGRCGGLCTDLTKVAMKE